MPSETVAKRATAPTQAASESASVAARGWGVFALGWLVPGLGYWLHRKWIRGGLVLGCITGMFAIGLALQGTVYAFNTGDILQMLGWLGDFCAGGLYFVTRLVGGGAGNPYQVTGDYGTVFLIAAGLLNLLAASDARDVYLGRKK
ncbi:MAG TPA: DUF6677 family protein [Terriglobales bacterium]|nr:DUF6677 family protein [Terriglobales bacterium]